MWRDGKQSGYSNPQYQQQQQQGSGEQIQEAAALPFEIEAVLKEDGSPITLLQTCNFAAHSPSFVGVDVKGTPVIVSFTEVSVRDRKVVPNENLIGRTIQR